MRTSRANAKNYGLICIRRCISALDITWLSPDLQSHKAVTRSRQITCTAKSFLRILRVSAWKWKLSQVYFHLPVSHRPLPEKKKISEGGCSTRLFEAFTVVSWGAPWKRARKNTQKKLLLLAVRFSYFFAIFFRTSLQLTKRLEEATLAQVICTE